MSEPRGPIGSSLLAMFPPGRPGPRLAALAFVFICAGALSLALALSHRPRLAILYAGLPPEEAARVADQLREMKVPHRVGPGGAIQAPADQVDELRLRLAAKGLPAAGQTGFELFDRAQFGLSDFGEKINYQRALEGELARTICHLDSVREARVHIALPRDSLYEEKQTLATASVVLDLEGGRSPSPAEVRSIAHLVAGAVGGLAPERVTILDARGGLLSGPDELAGASAASSQLELRRAYEQEIEQAVQTMLDQIVGQGKSIVRASADINFDRVETESETYQPAPIADTQTASSIAGVLQSRRELRETYRGLGEETAAGVPGVASNTRPPAIVRAAEPEDYQRTETTDQYLVSRQVERRLSPPGQLRRLSVAVFVDEKAKLGDMKALRSAVAAAVGVKPGDEEAITITRLPFEAAPAPPRGTAASAVRQFYFAVGRDLVAIVLLVLFLWFARGILTRPRQARQVSRAGGQVAVERTGPADRSAPQLAVGLPQPTTSNGSGETTSPDLPFEAEQAAAVVRRWLGSEMPAPAAGPEERGPAAG